MRNLLIHSILAAVAGLAILPAAAAQNSSRPDLSGIWSRTGPGAHQPFGQGAPPLQAWAKTIYEENERGLPPAEDGRDDLDPVIYCMVHGIPRIMAGNQPFEIVQTPGQVVLLFEAHSVLRRIYLDGRKLPENFPPSFMGFSTGKYDGDTLVVETAGLNDLTWLDRTGIPHSEDLHVTERMRRASREMLEIAFRFDDPKAFTSPWEARKTYQLKPDWEILENIGYCEDRFRYNYKRKAFRGTVDWQSPEQASGR
jgi:hypothetical protein